MIKRPLENDSFEESDVITIARISIATNARSFSAVFNFSNQKDFNASDE